jgi:hypothetical protein
MAKESVQLILMVAALTMAALTNQKGITAMQSKCTPVHIVRCNHAHAKEGDSVVNVL